MECAASMGLTVLEGDALAAKKLTFDAKKALGTHVGNEKKMMKNEAVLQSLTFKAGKKYTIGLLIDISSPKHI